MNNSNEYENNETYYLQKFQEANLELTHKFLYKKGLCGLTNLGNTCFMNSIIQCLNNTRGLLQYFISNNFKEDINNSKIEKHIIEQWNIVVRSLWYKNAIVSPKRLLQVIQIVARNKGYHNFTGFRQNDSQEFLQFFLESLHNGLSHEVIMRINGRPNNQLDEMAIKALENWKAFFKNDYSKIINIFYGQFITKIETDKDNITELNYTYEPFNSLSLEIPSKNNVSLMDCLDHFTSIEEIVSEISKTVNESENNKTSNQYNSKTLVRKTKQTYFWNLPDAFVIFFKRWTNSGEKNNALIDFPIDKLDMSSYMRGYNCNKYVYDLYGVVNHMGGSGGGHYISYVKNEDGNWYKFNDSIVSTMSPDNIVSADAYCLFYQKRT